MHMLSTTRSIKKKLVCNRISKKLGLFGPIACRRLLALCGSLLLGFVFLLISSVGKGTGEHGGGKLCVSVMKRSKVENRVVWYERVEVIGAVSSATPLYILEVLGVFTSLPTCACKHFL